MTVCVPRRSGSRRHRRARAPTALPSNLTGGECGATPDKSRQTDAEVLQCPSPSRPWLPHRTTRTAAFATTGRAQEVRALFALPFPELMFRAQAIHRLHFDPTEVQISTLLSIKTGGCPEDCAYCPQSIHYDTGVKAEKLMSRRRGRRRGACRPAGGRQPLLHGRRLARAERSRSRQGLRDGRGRQSARARELRDARHAHRRSGAAAQVGRPRLLQSQPRHLAGILRRHHHHPHLPGPPRHARARARRRHPCLLRRHRRHGRERRGPGRHDRDARQPAGASGIGADQHAGRGRGHAARAAAPSSIRSTSCAPSRSPASPCRNRWCGSRPGART